ncbi:MAG: hypothetical protein HY038_00465 [Nitrospirae bacterium]|nr:hypothetical protein [Nitrospirota bacterium]
MVMMEAVMAGDGSIEFPSEGATGRDEPATGYFSRRLDAQSERETRKRVFFFLIT